MTLQCLVVYVHGGTVSDLVILLPHMCLANEVFNFLRVDIMTPTAEEDLLLLLEPSFPFSFHATALTLF
jgi:hypothetical protein